MCHSGTFDILIVDDETGIRQILSEFFISQNYRIRTASNGMEALEMVIQKAPDLVISDIQMPVMDGFELFAILDSQYPAIKHILMTSYDIDRYLSLIRRYNIGNILSKGPEFRLNEISSYVRSILTGEIFGLHRYLPKTTLSNETISSYAQAKSICSSIVKSLPVNNKSYLEMAIDELVSNAFFHAVLKLSDLPRESWSESYNSQVDNAIKLTWGFDKEKIGFSVEDPKGNLTKNDALKWLDSNREEKINEEHGRGLLLVRKLIDRLIINIDPGKRTECVIIQYLDRIQGKKNKPLMIHEL
ncbi:MAG TPA: response regulator [Chitinispirillaceae bacterium]|nr:response regulator [Chitinispirillaceae bacterium]